MRSVSERERESALQVCLCVYDEIKHVVRIVCLHLLMQMKPKTVAGIPCHSCDYLVNSLFPEWDFNLRDYAAVEKREKVREAQFCCLTLFDHSFISL